MIMKLLKWSSCVCILRVLKKVQENKNIWCGYVGKSFKEVFCFYSNILCSVHTTLETRVCVCYYPIAIVRYGKAASSVCALGPGRIWARMWARHQDDLGRIPVLMGHVTRRVIGLLVLNPGLSLHPFGNHVTRHAMSIFPLEEPRQNSYRGGSTFLFLMQHDVIK